MCGIACVLGTEKIGFEQSAFRLLYHRGPDDKGKYEGENILFVHTRLSILELSYAGHQPMHSSCGRYVICYNGEIYNHKELRTRYLGDHHFRGESDTETVIELFRLLREKTMNELVGMWSMFIWDIQEKRLFISRDRFGQKPLYYTQNGGQWLFSSEIKPLLNEQEHHQFESAALADFLAMGNYGHLGEKTFYKNIKQFPQGGFAWVREGDTELKKEIYWRVPDIALKDKEPFGEKLEKELHDSLVEAVLSQTLSDVSLGITLSGGIDSSIVAGILATYYDKNVNAFTAQSRGSDYDETKYVDAVLEKYPHIYIHRFDLKELSIRNAITDYLNIQEEPFGDPSIMAHGFLMKMAAENGIKVILGGQGADELFFGYTSMLPAVLLRQFRGLHTGKLIDSLTHLRFNPVFLSRSLLLLLLPNTERAIRKMSRNKRRQILNKDILDTNNDTFKLPNYNNFYEVWKESLYGIHLPHLTHYDDRNAMAYSIEGRMPFLDHRIAECVAKISPSDFFKHGLRKYPLRKACERYIPELVQNRKDKIGFYTPLIDALYKDQDWISKNINEFIWIKNDLKGDLLDKLFQKNVDINDALLLWRFLVTNCWRKQFNIEAQ